MTDTTELEWRIIPDLKSYEVNKDGDVRNRSTMKILSETENKKNGKFFYSLRRKDGRMTSRGHWGLVCQAFPEVLEGWATIKDFPNYIINAEGEVMGKLRWTVLAMDEFGGVWLHKNNKKHKFYPRDYILDRDIEEWAPKALATLEAA